MLCVIGEVVAAGGENFRQEEHSEPLRRGLNRGTVFTLVLCVPMYNMHPYFGLHFKQKKKEGEKRGSGCEKIA